MKLKLILTLLCVTVSAAHAQVGNQTAPQYIRAPALHTHNFTVLEGTVPAWVLPSHNVATQPVRPASTASFTVQPAEASGVGPAASQPKTAAEWKSMLDGLQRRYELMQASVKQEVLNAQREHRSALAREQVDALKNLEEAQARFLDLQKQLSEIQPAAAQAPVAAKPNEDSVAIERLAQLEARLVGVLKALENRPVPVQPQQDQRTADQLAALQKQLAHITAQQAAQPTTSPLPASNERSVAELASRLSAAESDRARFQRQAEELASRVNTERAQNKALQDTLLQQSSAIVAQQAQNPSIQDLQRRLAATESEQSRIQAKTAEAASRIAQYEQELSVAKKALDAAQQAQQRVQLQTVVALPPSRDPSPVAAPQALPPAAATKAQPAPQVTAAALPAPVNSTAPEQKPVGLASKNDLSSTKRVYELLPSDGEIAVGFARWAEAEGIRLYWRPRAQPAPSVKFTAKGDDALSAIENALSVVAASGIRLKMCEFENSTVVIVARSDSCSETATTLNR